MCPEVERVSNNIYKNKSLLKVDFLQRKAKEDSVGKELRMLMKMEVATMAARSCGWVIKYGGVCVLIMLSNFCVC